MKFSYARRLSGLFVISISLIVLIWGMSPVNIESNTFFIENVSNLELDSFSSKKTTNATSMRLKPEVWRLTINFPSRIHVGDQGYIHINLDRVNESQDLSIGEEIVDHKKGDSSMVSVDNQSYNQLLEASLDMTELKFVPPGSILLPLSQEEAVHIEYQVTPVRENSYRGSIWLYLHHITLDGGEDFRYPLSFQNIEINAEDLLGLSGPVARLVGTLALLAGLFLFTEDFSNWSQSLFDFIQPK